MTLATQRLQNETIQPFRLPDHGNPAGGLTVEGDCVSSRLARRRNPPVDAAAREIVLALRSSAPCKGLLPWKGSSNSASQSPVLRLSLDVHSPP
jgi:hypothetical protein